MPAPTAPSVPDLPCALRWPRTGTSMPPTLIALTLMSSLPDRPSRPLSLTRLTVPAAGLPAGISVTPPIVTGLATASSTASPTRADLEESSCRVSNGMAMPSGRIIGWAKAGPAVAAHSRKAAGRQRITKDAYIIGRSSTGRG
ncbi:hypothetical protein BV95_03788 [Sphingobium chlorophenolicum]|uniref:Uncharacterized protein n=1 Tax=Sphingobium chlorophenolicum TaxID=46429 RepID=A0A081R9V0_SPHCR|nr:hypothetical protein BV95_03788 [Sphingobium chlorophenolicum]